MKIGEIWRHHTKIEILEVIITGIDNDKDSVLWKYSKPPVNPNTYSYPRKRFIKFYHKVYNEDR